MMKRDVLLSMQFDKEKYASVREAVEGGEPPEPSAVVATMKRLVCPTSLFVAESRAGQHQNIKRKERQQMVMKQTQKMM